MTTLADSILGADLGKTITLEAGDGHRLTGYWADPLREPKGALVVIQEIFGVNSHIRAVADGFADDGYIALAPALFDRAGPGIELGYTPEDVETGREIRAKIDHDDAVRDMEAAVKALNGHNVGVVGYCWGGSLAWNAATRLKGVNAAVGYPVLFPLLYTTLSIPMDRLRKVIATHPEVPVHIYPAGHGFNCDQRGSYDAASATLARQRTLEFFEEHVARG